MENKQQLIEQLTSVIEEMKKSGEHQLTEWKDKVDNIKNAFYRPSNDEQDAPTDEQEQLLHQLLSQYKQMRAEIQKQVDEQLSQNLLRKENILAQMRDLAQATTDVALDNLKKMKELQAEWKTIGTVPPPKVQQIAKEFQLYLEQFYDMLKINIELRDLDFRKNFEMKTLLCEAAEKLQNDNNIIQAQRALQQLHEQWANIGPVAREYREDLWTRFKTASSIINKKHQAYFDELHQHEQDNLLKKQQLLEQLRAINVAQLTTNKHWDEASALIQSLQEQWRQIGFAPKKFNQSVYTEYRTICDDFFKAKTTFYRTLRENLAANLKRKKELLQQALQLQDSTDWLPTTKSIIALQQEWKTIGAVPRKYSEDLWKQFNAVCDNFFEKRRAAENEAKQISKQQKTAQTIAGANRNKLIRMYETLQQEIQTAENNILFFNAKSKSANKLVEGMQKKIDALKQQLKELECKINEEA